MIKKTPEEIGVEEWRKAFQQAVASMDDPPDDGGLRGSEIQGMLGIGRNQFHKLARQLIESGRMRVYRAFRPNVLGERQKVPVYKMVDDG